MATAQPIVLTVLLAPKLFLLLVFLLSLCAIVLGARHYLHMLQLSSYQFQGYFRFFRMHPGYLFYHAFAFVLQALVCVCTDSPLIWCLVALFFAVFAIILFRPVKAKKKFAVTARVKRLIAILFLLYALCTVCTILLRGIVSWVFVQPFFLALLALFVAVANLLALPVEKAVQRRYIKDAQRMLMEHPGLRIIGITGSFGKTSVKHYLTELLTEEYDVLMTPGSFNTPMGVVRTIREQLRPTHEIFVCEMGARHVGDIKEICDIVHPHDGILTALGDQHLETFHTRENIINTKYELLDAVEAARCGGEQLAKAQGNAFGNHPECLKFLNGDDEILAQNRRYTDAITYGLGEGNDYRGEILSVDAGGTTVKVTIARRDGEEEETFVLTTPLVGRHNVVNVLGAVAVAHTLGVSAEKCRKAARRLKVAEHRLEIKKAPYGVILDDAYNSNPAGAKAALETMEAVAVSGAEKEGRPMLKILVTPGMVELGEKQEEYNKAFGAQAAGVCDYILTVGRTNREAILKGVEEAGIPDGHALACDTLAEAMTKMVSLEAGRPRVILLENDLPDDY